MRGPLIALALVVTLAAPAVAADEPSAYGVAQQGSLKVVADVLLETRGGEMKGGWLNDRLPCTTRRLLIVRVDVDVVRPGGTTSRVRRARSGRVDNCAEGGPNFGYELDPKTLGLGCADGRWAPGRYAMTTRVTDTASGLRASASLYRQVTRRC